MAATRSRRQADTAQRILDVSERLVQSRGFNGISYADVAAELGIAKASLHYHFPAKADLGQRLIERYEKNFLAALGRIDATGKDARDKLRRYAAIYEEVLRADRMCLCGMLAAEYATLPAPMQAGLTRFFDANEHWLTAVLEDGLRSGTFSFKEAAKERARVLLGALEGAMLVARSYGDPGRFKAAADCLLADLRAER